MATSRKIRGPCAALILAAFIFPHAWAREARVVYQVRSQYQQITVLDTANGHRRLIFDGRLDGLDPIQSEMNLDAPEELTLSYTRHIMSALPVAGKLRRILIIGLGGASMQRYLHRLLPDATIETAELDPVIRDIAAKYFDFREDDRQIVHIGDGRVFVEASRDHYDVIFLDAFGADSIPYRLTTREFLEAVKARLAEGGVACANLWDGAPEYPDMLRTYAAVFPELHVVKCSSSGNSVLLALPVNMGLTVQTWMGKAGEFEKAYPTDLDLARLIERGAAETIRIPARARILLDKDKGGIAWEP